MNKIIFTKEELNYIVSKIKIQSELNHNINFGDKPQVYVPVLNLEDHHDKIANLSKENENRILGDLYVKLKINEQQESLIKDEIITRAYSVMCNQNDLKLTL